MGHRNIVKLLVFLLVGIVAFGAYYFLVLRNKETDSPPAPQVQNYTENDAVVVGNVQEIGAMVVMYYFDTKKIPADISEIVASGKYPEFKLKNNPITNKPYSYTVKPDKSGFIVSGTRSDGSSYELELPLD